MLPSLTAQKWRVIALFPLPPKMPHKIQAGRKSGSQRAARLEGVSVVELVRSRCKGRQGADQAMLATLTAELREAVKRADASLKRGLDDANAVMADLRARHEIS